MHIFPLILAQTSGGSFIALFTIFILATMYGADLITKVPPTLHTPLMSGSNAISGITIVGALIAAGSESAVLTTVFGFIAIVAATINVVGGYLVTDRMLGMFKKKG
ncbi:MAG: NAD(P) transhydrogenase subunit alpha [Phycisphaeraceae bacterium]